MKKLLGITSLLILVYIYFWVTNPADSQLRFHDTGLNTHLVVSPDTRFEEYVVRSHEIIKLARKQGGVDSSEQVVAQNAPRLLLPDASVCKKMPDGKFENGILLIHGLLDSGYTMNVLGEFLQKKCFAVEIILLPGHGTVPGDLLNVDYQDWIESAHYGVTQLERFVKNKYIMGYSLGGLLAVNEILQDPKSFKAAILFGPVLGLHSQYQPMVPAVYWLSRIIPRLQWLAFFGDHVNVRYESYPLNPVYQIVKLMARVNQQLALQPLTLPLFMQQSADDMTIDPWSNLNLFAHDANPLSTLLWYAESHVPQVDKDPRIKFIDAALPAQRILDMSHLSYLMPASDPIYGLYGSYRDCLYYTENSASWQQCRSGKNNFLGEITLENVRAHVIQRLTFNPFQPQFFDELSKFLDAVGKV
jgi:esterase/lipase